MICGMNRSTGKAEFVKAALESIAYQISSVIDAMQDDSGIALHELRVDGSPTNNRYLMQFLSDISRIPILVPETEELSGIGAAYSVGLKLGFYNNDVFNNIRRKKYLPIIDNSTGKERKEVL